MTVKAYVLIGTEAAKTAQAAAQLREVPGVVEASEVMGPYDVVVIMEVPELLDVTTLLSQRIRKIDGIQSTITCVTMP